MTFNGVKIVRNIRSGLENLLLHKLRSFLTMLGVVFGVGSVVAMLSVGEGAGREALEQIRKLGSNNILISSVKPVEEQSASMSRPSAGMSIYGLTYEDHQRMAESLEHVERTAPVKLLRQQGRLGERTLEVRVVGTSPEWFELVNREVLAGRVLLPRQPGHAGPHGGPDRVRRPEAAGHEAQCGGMGPDRRQVLRDHRHRPERRRQGRRPPDAR